MDPKQNRVQINNRAAPLAVEQLPLGFFVTVTDEGKGTELRIQ